MNRLPADQQQRDAALDPSRSVIVQAPAGSGKTGLLSQRFLRLLAMVEQPEEIVAITFTRKASAEMRERILDAMRDARNGEAETAEGNNQRLTRELATKALQRDHEQAWGLLENPSRLRIMTIDAFNAMLTRQMPVTSQFGQQPAITEDGMAVCRDAARRLLRMADDKGNRGEEPTAAVRLLLAHLDNRLNDATELVAMMLARRDLWLRHLDIHGLDREVLEANLAEEVGHVLDALWHELPSGLVSSALERAQVAVQLLRDGELLDEKNKWLLQLAEHDDHPSTNADDLRSWQLLGRFLLTANGEGDVRKPGGLRVDGGFPPPSKVKGEDKAARERHKNAMADILEALDDAPVAVTLLKRVARLPVPRYSDEQWQVLEAINSLLPHAVLCLQEQFRDRGEVDFAELAIRARQALGDEDNPTDLAMRLDYQVQHLLVDEFQDTSHSQIDLLLRLTRGWEPDDGRSLFLVGDPMQSIYAFREAEVGHFLAVRDYGLGPLALESLRLTANFRSQAGIVEWVNRAFGGDAKEGIPGIFPARDRPLVGAIAYEPSEATHAELPGAAVNIHAIGAQPGRSAAESEAMRVVELLREADSDPESRRSAVLVRGRRHLLKILPALREAGIRFQAVELEALEAQPEIQDLFALTRVIVNPADITALYSVCRAPWCGMTLAELQALNDIAAKNDIAPWQALLQEHFHEALATTTRTSARRIANALEQAWLSCGRRGLRERVESAWLAMGGPAILRAADELENATLFIELLQQLEEAGDLDDVNELDQRLTSLYAAPDPAAGERVQLMTLHKAKGLQFDNVIIPALDQVTGMKDRLLFHWIERPGPHGDDRVLLGPLKSRLDEEGGAIYRFIEQLREEKADFELARLLYVGVTRAERRVHLLGKATFSFGRDGVAQLSAPRNGSLLSLLWQLPEVQAAFTALPLPQAVEDAAENTTATHLLRRVTSDWQLPAIPTGPEIEIRERGIASGGGDDERIVYEWAGDRVRHTGTLVHRMLERMARDGVREWSEDRLASLPLEQRLRAMGLPENECTDAASDARRALVRALHSENGHWMLEAHDEARCEWALSGIDDGELVNVSIDRSFVDGNGTRWIIDYKTSTHEGGDAAAFLANQRERYRQQLERYARVVGRLEDRPQKVALYFPLQDEFIAWTPET